MGIEVLIPLLAVFSIFFVPIVGVMLILVSKFALAPLVETLSKALRESGYQGPGGDPKQLAELTEQVQMLTDEVEKLRELRTFDQQLLGSDSTSE